PHQNVFLLFGSQVAHHTVSQPTYELDLATLQPDPATIAGGIVDPATGMIQPLRELDAAVFAQVEWHALSNVNVVAGGRYDYNSIFSLRRSGKGLLSQVAPRVAVVYTALEQLTLRATYGEAFRNPSLFEAAFDDRASVC